MSKTIKPIIVETKKLQNRSFLFLVQCRRAQIKHERTRWNFINPHKNEIERTQQFILMEMRHCIHHVQDLWSLSVVIKHKCSFSLLPFSNLKFPHRLLNGLKDRQSGVIYNLSIFQKLVGNMHSLAQNIMLQSSIVDDLDCISNIAK